MRPIAELVERMRAAIEPPIVSVLAGLSPTEKTILFVLIVGSILLALLSLILRQIKVMRAGELVEVLTPVETSRPALAPEPEVAARLARQSPTVNKAVPKELLSFQRNASTLREHGKSVSSPAPEEAIPHASEVRAQLVITPLRAETSSASEISTGRQLAERLEAALDELAPYVAIRTGAMRPGNAAKMRLACFELRGSVRVEASRTYFDIELIDAKTDAKIYWARRAVRDQESLLADIVSSVIKATPIAVS